MTADSDYYTSKLYKFRRVLTKIKGPGAVFVPPGKISLGGPVCSFACVGIENVRRVIKIRSRARERGYWKC